MTFTIQIIINSITSDSELFPSLQAHIIRYGISVLVIIAVISLLLMRRTAKYLLMACLMVSIISISPYKIEGLGFALTMLNGLEDLSIMIALNLHAFRLDGKGYLK
jgi:hypothetical protein